jgi:translation initiation factor 2B subunit (eIF-2B alpha/beta/delta family)
MNAEQLVAQAASDRTRGAGEIERDLVRGLLEAGGPWPSEQLERWARQLVMAHPAMANVRRLAAEMRSGRSLVAFLERRSAHLDDLPGLLSRHGSPLVLGCDRVVTVSRSSAVAAVLGGAARAGWTGEVVVLDGTAAGGGTEQAARLVAQGFRVRSLPDGAAASVLSDRRGGVLVAVGADAVGPRRVVNAAGTWALVEVAAVCAVPRVVVADSGKNLDEADVDALVGSIRTHTEEGPGRTWPVFEATPRERFTHRVSEEGLELQG